MRKAHDGSGTLMEWATIELEHCKEKKRRTPEMPEWATWSPLIIYCRVLTVSRHGFFPSIFFIALVKGGMRFSRDCGNGP